MLTRVSYSSLHCAIGVAFFRRNIFWPTAGTPQPLLRNYFSDRRPELLNHCSGTTFLTDGRNSSTIAQELLSHSQKLRNYPTIATEKPIQPLQLGSYPTIATVELPNPTTATEERLNHGNWGASYPTKAAEDLLNRVFATYQIMSGWETYQYYYETVELPNPRPTQPKKK